MPRDRLLFKYVGDGSEFHEGIPARDLRESDRARLTDEQMVTLAASKLYQPRNDADEEVAEAEQRIERAEPAPDFGVAPVAPDPPAAANKKR